MRASWKRAIFISVLAAAFVGALLIAFWPRAVPVDFASLDRGEIVVTVDAEGIARVRDVYTVAAPLAGRLARIELRPGDAVETQSTLLASIEEMDPSFLDARTRAETEARLHAAEAALALARAEHDQAQAYLDFARVELRRRQELHARGATTTRSLEEAQLDVRTGEARVATAEAAVRMRVSELESARAALIEPGSPDAVAGPRCCVPIRAPVDGTVLRVLQESETVVQAGTPLVEIGDPTNLEIRVDLPSREAVNVQPGARVTIEGWGGSSLAGEVRRVEPSAFTRVSALGIEEQRVNVLIDLVETAESEQRDRLGHGYRVMTHIEIDRADEVLRVPVGALFRADDRWAVFQREDDRAVLAYPEIGLMNDRFAEIASGLPQDAVVILHPSDGVDDQTRVAAREVGR
ncbi:HlyD family efflux transporter periplasmic adaptor subunit [Fodinicurvata sp. EGI_FJ10296]|uniref:efflux RND transporter periplasmic adaptor subunit n=1 Tax=Fodinicurvata sp. EGI_FJ10296 TaxID=3231908 RepID=UPI0034554B4D